MQNIHLVRNLRLVNGFVINIYNFYTQEYKYIDLNHICMYRQINYKNLYAWVPDLRRLRWPLGGDSYGRRQVIEEEIITPI